MPTWYHTYSLVPGHTRINKPVPIPAAPNAPTRMRQAVRSPQPFPRLQQPISVQQMMRGPVPIPAPVPMNYPSARSVLPTSTTPRILLQVPQIAPAPYLLVKQENRQPMPPGHQVPILSSHSSDGKCRAYVWNAENYFEKEQPWLVRMLDVEKLPDCERLDRITQSAMQGS